MKITVSVPFPVELVLTHEDAQDEQPLSQFVEPILVQAMEHLAATKNPVGLVTTVPQTTRVVSVVVSLPPRIVVALDAVRSRAPFVGGLKRQKSKLFANLLLWSYGQKKKKKKVPRKKVSK